MSGLMKNRSSSGCATTCMTVVRSPGAAGGTGPASVIPTGTAGTSSGLGSGGPRSAGLNEPSRPPTHAAATAKAAAPSTRRLRKGTYHRQDPRNLAWTLPQRGLTEGLTKAGYGEEFAYLTKLSRVSSEVSRLGPVSRAWRLGAT